MSFVVSVSRVVRATPAACWAALADFPSWKRFMPGSFRPMWGPDRALRKGDWMFVRLNGLPMPIRVFDAEPGRLLAWGGGPRCLLAANHKFFFDQETGGRTTVRSEETWSGLATLSGAMQQKIREGADRVGVEQVEGLVRYLESVS